jgi:heterodisulfide reductase subunit C
MIICNNGADVFEFEALEDEDVEESEGLPLQRVNRGAKGTLAGKGGKVEWQVPAAVSEFGDLLEGASGVDTNACYQCRKCVSGCPVAYAMDYTPVQLLHAVRLGLKDLVLGSATIWLCASCETCVTRCPQNVDIVKAMDSLRVMALKSGIKPAVPEVAGFYRASLQNIRLFGRMYELGLIAQLKLSTRQFLKDLDLGGEMLKRGKLKLLPEFASLGGARRVVSRTSKLDRK